MEPPRPTASRPRPRRWELEVVLNEGYPSGITDVTSIIQKLRMANADIVFPVSYFTDAVLIIRSMRQVRPQHRRCSAERQATSSPSSEKRWAI